MNRQPKKSGKIGADRQQVRRELVFLTGLCLVVAVAAVGVIVFLQQRNASANGSPIDGIGCTDQQTAYHEHAHLRILDHGRTVTVGDNIGNGNNTTGCIYWVHTHKSNGVIHLEAPYRVVPTLGTFFDLWGQPLSDRRVAGVTAATGERVLIYVNRRMYRKDPRAIPLLPNTDIAIEVGAPFSRPSKFDFNTVQ